MGSTRRMHKNRRTFQKQYIYWQDIPFQTFWDIHKKVAHSLWFRIYTLQGNKIADTDFSVIQNQNRCTIGRSYKKWKFVQLLQNTASEIIYCCVQCRNCKYCKGNDEIEVISLKEEIEQYLAKKTVAIDKKNRVCTAKLAGVHKAVVSWQFGHTSPNLYLTLIITLIICRKS